MIWCHFGGLELECVASLVTEEAECGVKGLSVDLAV